MATCVGRLPCPDCGSSDSIQTYLNIDEALGIEWYTSFCHGACWANKGTPYQDGKAPEVHVKTAEEIQDELATVRGCKPFKPARAYRSIPKNYFLSWSLRLILSEFDGKTPYGVAFPLSVWGTLVGWKCRTFKGKNFFGVGETANTDPFGFERALALGGDTLWITEGEYDAIALDYCMTLVGTHPKYPVISLTHGGGSIFKNLNAIESRIAHYKYIVLVLDNDDVGQVAEDTARDILSNIWTVPKPNGAKDANDALKNGDGLLMGTMALGFLSYGNSNEEHSQ